MRPSFLAQNVVPMPGIQLFCHFHRPKFTVSHQQNGDSFGQKGLYLCQQSELSLRRAMPPNVLDPCPGNWDRYFPIRQTDNQQLMGKTNLSPIHNQPHLLKEFSLHFQPFACDWRIPITNHNRWINQQSGQALGQTEQFHFTRYLSRNSAHSNRTALVDTNYQLGKIANARYSFSRSKLSRSHNPGMIKIVDRHDALLFFLFTNSGVQISCRSTFLPKAYGG